MANHLAYTLLYMFTVAGDKNRRFPWNPALFFVYIDVRCGEQTAASQMRSAGEL